MNPIKVRLLKDQRGFGQIMVFILSVLILGSIGVVGYKVDQDNKKPVPEKSETSAHYDSKIQDNDDRNEVVERRSTKSKPDSEYDDLEGTIMRYTSPSLGITFTYLTDWFSKDGSQIPINETVVRKGDKVCIGGSLKDKSFCDAGQTVEVFNKKSSQSLKEAIEEQLLKSYNREDCFVKALNDNDRATGSGDDKAEITYPYYSSHDDPFSEATASKCPADYSALSGLRYFAAFNNRPDKFAFFDIGQYGILANPDNVTWQYTFEFIK